MPTLHRVTIGRTREVRGPDAFECGMVGVIVAVVMAIAVWFGIQLLHITQALDAVSLATGPEINEIVHYAEHGRWPSPGDPNTIAPNTPRGRHAGQLTLGKDGVITANVTFGPTLFNQKTFATHSIVVTQGALSFRPELLGARNAPSITFLCGYAQPVAGSSGTLGENQTTLAEKNLPPFCR